jgi:hypothetical protein
MSNGGLVPGSSTFIDVMVDASVAMKWFVPENHSVEATLF